jgi:hypothetical protein
MLRGTLSALPLVTASLSPSHHEILDRLGNYAKLCTRDSLREISNCKKEHKTMSSREALFVRQSCNCGDHDVQAVSVNAKLEKLWPKLEFMPIGKWSAVQSLNNSLSISRKYALAKRISKFLRLILNKVLCSGCPIRSPMKRSTQGLYSVLAYRSEW